MCESISNIPGQPLQLNNVISDHGGNANGRVKIMASE